MTDDRSLERAARSWLETGPTQAPDRAVDAALLRIQTTSQERDWHVPWRTTKMFTPARVVAAAIIGVLVIGTAFVYMGGRPQSVIAPTPTPSPSPRPPAPRPRHGRASTTPISLVGSWSSTSATPWTCPRRTQRTTTPTSAASTSWIPPT